MLESISALRGIKGFALVGTTYGYVRVSTREQKTDRQLTAMVEFGVPKDKVCVDKQSGKDFNCKNFQNLHPYCSMYRLFKIQNVFGSWIA
jgi:predicted site-specific integrase-resolvase